MENKLYTSKEIREKLKIDTPELTKLRNNGKIVYEKVSPRKYIYELNEELATEFLKPASLSKNKSTTSAEEDVEYVLSDEVLEFPEVRSYYQSMKEQKKINAFVKRDTLIRTYRQLAEKPEVQNSIEEILNEVLTPFNTGEIVKIDFPDDKNIIGDSTKKVIEASFEKCIDLLDFDNNAFYLFRDWYIDGLKALECIYDNDNKKNGITNVISLSPIYLRDFRDSNTKKILYKYDRNLSNISAMMNSDMREVYKEEQMIYVGSGVYDIEKIYELSYLNSAIKSINDLAHIENGIIKYRITRASEKNVWNIDIGTMPKQKAENHLSSLAREISSNILYNTETGETNLDSTEGITDDWMFPSRNGKQKTTVETINGNSDFISKLEDLEYFRRKMYESMKIPVGRLDGDSSLDYSSMDILREELKFTKFVGRIRKQFANIFLEFIRRDVVSKGEITESDFIKLKKHIYIKWNQSNAIVENAELDNLQKRFELITELESSGVIGKYIPISYLVDRILKMSETEFEDYQKQIEKEKKKGFHKEEPKDDE